MTKRKTPPPIPTYPWLDDCVITLGEFIYDKVSDLVLNPPLNALAIMADKREIIRHINIAAAEHHAYLVRQENAGKGGARGKEATAATTRKNVLKCYKSLVENGVKIIKAKNIIDRWKKLGLSAEKDVPKQQTIGKYLREIKENYLLA